MTCKPKCWRHEGCPACEAWRTEEAEGARTSTILFVCLAGLMFALAVIGAWV